MNIRTSLIASATLGLTLLACGDDTTESGTQTATSASQTMTGTTATATATDTATATQGTTPTGGTDSESDSDVTTTTTTNATTSSTGSTSLTSQGPASATGSTTDPDTGSTGSTGNQEFVCDGSPVWDDPDGDGSLRLTGDETYGFDASTHSFSFLCTDDQSYLNVCEAETTLELTGDQVTVIAGLGIGPLNGQAIDIYVNAALTPEVHMLVDVSQNPVNLWFDTPMADVYVEGYGTFDLGYAGDVKSLTLEHPGGVVLNGINADGDVCVVCPVPDPPACP